MKEFTKSYGINRVAELIEENQNLRIDMEDFKKYHINGEIKFAIAELEKLKEDLEEELEDCKDLVDPFEYEIYHELLGVCRGYKNSIDYINEQILKLKEKLNG